MTTENVNPEIDLDDAAVAAMIEGDDHLRTLPLDSEDLKAAVADKKAAMTGEDDDSADVDENEDDESGEDKSKEDGKKPKKGWSKRVEKLVVQNHTKDRRIAELEAQLEDTVKRIASDAVGAFEYDVAEPVFDDFNTIADYSKAVARWEYGRIEAEKSHKQELRDVTQQVQDVKTAWEAKQEDARAAFDDFDEIVTIDSVTAAAPSQMAKEFLADSALGPQVIYQLLADSDLAEEFADASPAKQVRMLAKIEGTMDAPEQTTKVKKETAATKKTLKLPTPLPKGRATSQSFDLINDADRMSDAEWSKAFESQRRPR
jgi:hypothetical protein